MATNSFRRTSELAPLDYRTPSPPIHDVEPLSPGTAEWSGRWPEPSQRSAQIPTFANHSGTAKDKTRRSVDRNCLTGPPRDGAATTSSSHKPRRRQDSSPDRYSNAMVDRTGKRVGDYTGDQSVWKGGDYESVYDNTEELETRRLEAELLLNFSREACNKARSYSMTSLTAQRPDAQVEQLLVEQSPLASSGPPLQFDTYSDVLASGHNLNVKNQKKSSPDSMAEKVDGDISSAKIPQEVLVAPPQGSQPREEPLNQPSVAKDPPPSVQDTQAQRADKDEITEGIEAHIVAKALEQGAVVSTTNEMEYSASNFLEGIEEVAKADFSLASEPTVQAESSIQLPKVSVAKQKQNDSPSICAACNFTRNVLTAETENDATSWICCDGCRSWFHFACAGFKTEREVRGVDKFRCRKCKPIHGPTTYVRKSARAHSAIDYAGLNEGIIKSSDDNPEHHYIKPIKEGTIKFDAENFARMRPELVTADYFEKGDGMKEPVVIPAAFNPRPKHIPFAPSDEDDLDESEEIDLGELHDTSVLDSWLSEGFEYEQVQNCGQDSLDMVIPLDLTVRKVSEMYGPEEKIEVIDVKSQNGEDKKWNMKRWVDYYEAQGSKPVRNVISLEVSQSKLGRLIRRPKVVRDLDLQDSVWPADLMAKGDFPKVQFYCLMSVADCFTDFHIDFGGSSVYYHILKGKKTFFFIPPYEKHLKKYEEWCNSPAQNWTFLGDQTNECYRVDLSEGDTMLIPAGWIHAVWTPEDSLVIGGNFLTRMHYAMQIRVTQIEKATHVARKFRYPYFQKIMWYTAIRYLEQDAVPTSVQDRLAQGQEFQRSLQSYFDFDGHGENGSIDPEQYHSRYYSKAELDGLPELTRFLHRTALIASGSITDGISAEVRNAVKRSIPKGFGDPFELAQRFAVWVAWKRGNENIPHWAYPGYMPEGTGADSAEKKLSAKAIKKLDREAALQAWRVAPDRQSTRPRTQPQNFLAEIAGSQTPSAQPSKHTTPIPSVEESGGLKRKAETPSPTSPSANGIPSITKKPRTLSGTKAPSSRRPACEACRKGRRACKHRDELSVSGVLPGDVSTSVEIMTTPINASVELLPGFDVSDGINGDGSETNSTIQIPSDPARPSSRAGQYIHDMYAGKVATVVINGDGNPTPTKSSGRSKACKDCRKSKRRCVHDEFGNEDPAKLEQAVIPRPAAKKKRPSGESVDIITSKKSKKPLENQIYLDDQSTTFGQDSEAVDTMDVDRLDDSPEHVFESVIDPRLEAMSVSIPLPQQETSITANETEQEVDNEAQPATIPHMLSLEDEVNLIATSPMSESKADHQVEPEEVSPHSNVQQQATSSLVSPPESTHTDAEQTPPATAKPEGYTPPATTGSSRHSSRPAKNIQRYTPESGSARRASDSSAGQTKVRESATPPLGVGQTPTHKRTESRVNSQTDADEDSLRLIRELQAQDMGLRRRGRGS